ncbi:hypothetical protein BGW36DRAFT_387418 [Talaromyces proteolyticus]|uniref:Secreted protein n=1 Tax=Talaromyces proteolyticus TaxID=1131652 RepID=A0AAD4PUM1_9EURO|nr:uncharacterized protein BGW36DRAFT_387418 [Talaromyces proteolyticus]KAH8692335.1 hypothetical protein BGW36DRAFT_387418 [Talaromyces proteolyticus]
MLLSFLTFGFNPVCTAAEKFSVPNVNAAFHRSPKPFAIHVDRGILLKTLGTSRTHKGSCVYGRDRWRP